MLKKDFAEILLELEPAIATAAPGELQSLKFPFLRHLAMVDSEEGFGAIEGWSAFRARAKRAAPSWSRRAPDRSRPSDPGALFFSSGSTGKPKGILSAHRAVCLQLWRWERWHKAGDSSSHLVAERPLLVGQLRHDPRRHARRAAARLVLQPTFQADEALAAVDRRNESRWCIAWPHQWAQLEGAPTLADGRSFGCTLRSLRHTR